MARHLAGPANHTKIPLCQKIEGWEERPHSAAAGGGAVGPLRGKLHEGYDGLYPVGRDVRSGNAVEGGPVPRHHRPCLRTLAVDEPGGTGDNGQLPDNHPRSGLDRIQPQGSYGTAGEQKETVRTTADEPATGRPGKGDSGHADGDWAAAHERPDQYRPNGEQCAPRGTRIPRRGAAAGRRGRNNDGGG